MPIISIEEPHDQVQVAKDHEIFIINELKSIIFKEREQLMLCTKELYECILEDYLERAIDIEVDKIRIKLQDLDYDLANVRK